MSNKQEIKNELAKLLPQMKKVVKMLNKAEDNWTNYFNESDPEDMYLRNMLHRLADKLDDAKDIGEQIDKPIVAEGILYRNSAGRFAINEDHYFNSGSSIEYLLIDEENGDRWSYSSVEHDNDYYIVNNKKLNMEGLRARKKYSPGWD